MIDTINLRLHNIQTKYPVVYEKFFTAVYAKKHTIVDARIEVDNDGVISEKERRLASSRVYAANGKFLPVAVTSRQFSPSSSYEFIVRIKHADVTQAYMEIEFAIPKYLYGTNVYQFVAFPEMNSENNYVKLLRFIDNLWISLIYQRPDPLDVEINRIDFCYNQYFQNKHQALQYQESQKAYMREEARAKEARFLDGHGWNWTLLTDRYSFKCYYKGDEYRKHDRPVIEKAQHKLTHSLKEIDENADRILRYELTYRSTQMHYLTMYQFFESVVRKPGYILSNPMYQYIKRIAKWGEFSKFTNNFGIEANNAYGFFSAHKKAFYLKSMFDKPFSSLCVFESNVTFSYAVYRILFDWFWEKVKGCQIDSRSNLPEAIRKIRDYDARCGMRKKAKVTKKSSMTRKGGVHFGRLLVPAVLSQFYDLRLLKEHLPENTYYRLMADLKNAGIDFKTHDKTLVLPTLDYNDWRLFAGNKLRAL